MAFDRQPFASTHPAINALFAAEFAQSQAQRQAEAQAMANETARAQIGAQTQLAQSQMRQAQVQQDYNNLFRERELQSRSAAEQARQKLYEDQLKVDKAYKEGILKRPDARNQSEIDEINAMSDAVASQLNAAYDTRLETRKAAIEAARKKELGQWTPLTFDSTINTKYEQMLKDAEAQEFQNVLDIGTRFNSGQFRVDPATRKFAPIRLGPAAAALSAAAPLNPAALGAGGTPTTSTTTATPQYPVSVEDATKMIGPIVTKGFGYLADLFKPTTPTTATIGTTNAAPAVVSPGVSVTSDPTATVTPSVKQRFRGRVYLLTPEDTTELRTLLDGTDASRVPDVFKSAMEFYIRTGRAVPTDERGGGSIVVTTPDSGPAVTSDPRLANPDYLDSVLGPRFGQPERYGPVFNP